MTAETTTDVETTFEWGWREDGEDGWVNSVFDPETRTVVQVPFTEDAARGMVQRRYPYEAQLLRRTPGSEPEVVAYEPAVLPVPTDEDLHAERHGGVMLGALGEEGEWAIALGHIYPPDMAQAVTLMVRKEDTLLEAFGKGDVEHVYGVRIEAWGFDCEWMILWQRDGKPIPSATPGAFPLTVVSVH